MCLAIYKPQGNPISIDNLKHGWDNNDDGAGYCFINENNDIIIKKFMSWDAFIKEYVPDVTAYGDDSPFLIHFRITSKGATNIDNCHPFKVNDDMAIIHNGTISNIDIDKLDRRSDTKIFAEEYLANIGETLLDNIYVFELAQGFIGYSKVCILHRERGVFILNEHLGHWNDEDDCWYSNESYKPRKTYLKTTTTQSKTYYPSTTSTTTTKTFSSGRDVIVYDGGNWSWEDSDKTETCSWCLKEVDSTTQVHNSFGVEMNLCDGCYDDYADIYDDDLCTVCGMSAVTEEYYSEDVKDIVKVCATCASYAEYEDMGLTKIVKGW